MVNSLYFRPSCFAIHRQTRFKDGAYRAERPRPPSSCLPPELWFLNSFHSLLLKISHKLHFGASPDIKIESVDYDHFRHQPSLMYGSQHLSKQFGQGSTVHSHETDRVAKSLASPVNGLSLHTKSPFFQ